VRFTTSWSVGVGTFVSHSRLIPFLGIFFIILLFPGTRSSAATATWLQDPTSSDWNTAANWSAGAVPNGPTDTAVFDLSNTNTLSISATTQVNGVIFNADVANPFTFTLDPAISLTISGAGIANLSGITQNFETLANPAGPGAQILFTGTATAGTLTQFTNDGANTASGTGGTTTFSGNSSAGSAILIANGGTNGGPGGAIVFTGSATGGTAQVILNGNSTFDISGITQAAGVSVGSIQGSGTLFLGDNQLTVGSNNLSTTIAGAIANAGPNGGIGSTFVKTGTGTLTLAGVSTYTGQVQVTGGTLVISGTVNNANSYNMIIDGTAANAPALELAVSGSLSASGIIIGDVGAGSFTQDGGYLDTGGGMLVGANTASAGTFTLNGGYMESGGETVGGSGIGTFIQTGGTNYAPYSDCYVGGNDTPGQGTYSLSGGLVQSLYAFIGDTGTGNFIQTGGTNIVTDQMYIGQATDGGGVGSYIQSGGANVVDGGLILGELLGAKGTYVLSGGILTTPSVAGSSGTGVFDFNGGVLQPSASSTAFMSSLTTANVQSGGAIINPNGFSITIPQPLLHDTTSGASAIDGGLTVTGSGNLTLSGSNTYTGPTIVDSGSLTLQSGGALASSLVTVGSGTSSATLQLHGGNYTIGAGSATLILTANTGSISLTDGIIDTLTIGGTNAGSTLSLAGSDYISVDISGTASDSIALSPGGTASIAGTNYINPTFLFLSSGTDVLITAPGGGLATGTFAFAPPAFTFVGTESLINTGTSLIFVGQINPAPVTAWFTGTFDSNWSTIIGSGTSGLVNFSTDSAGSDNAGQVPYFNTDVHFYATAASGETLSTTLGQNFTVNSLTVDGTNLGGETQPVSIAGDTLTLIGAGGNGITLDPGAGALTITSAVVVGGSQQWSNNSSNPLIISGSSVTLDAPLIISGSGYTTISTPVFNTGTATFTKAGTGTLTLSGDLDYLGNATASAGSLAITGTVSGPNSTFTVDGNPAGAPEMNLSSGALLSINEAIVGVTGTGGFLQTGGSLTSNTLILGQRAGGNGTYTLTGGALAAYSYFSGFINVGQSGTGNFIQTGGTNTLGVDISLGENAGSSGSYNLSNGYVQSQSIAVGVFGNGSFIQTGGTNYIGDSFTVGADAGSNGTYSLSGGLMVLPYFSTYIGDSGTGSFVQTGGTSDAENLFLGYNAGSKGTYTLNGGFLQSNFTGVSNSGTGYFIQTGGTNSSSTLRVAALYHSIGSYTLGGGVLQSGEVAGGGGDSFSTFDFNGGTLRAAESTTGLMSAFSEANIQTGGAIIDTNGFSDTIPQGLVHDESFGAASTDGGLTKIGLGKLTLSASNNYTGPTTVNAGTLIVSGNLVATGTATVASGAILEIDGRLNTSALSTVSGSLQGSGSVGAINILSGGTLAPGLNSASGSAGTLTAFGNVTLTDSTSIFSIRLGVATPTDQDQLTLDSGNVSLNGATLDLTLDSAFLTPANGATYILINGQPADSIITGEFAQGITISENGTQFQVAYGVNATDTAPGSDVLLITIPEPPSSTIFLAAAAMIIAWQHRRLQKKVIHRVIYSRLQS
jgi:autotransporter-associated beta strand protein